MDFPGRIRLPAGLQSCWACQISEFINEAAGILRRMAAAVTRYSFEKQARSHWRESDWQPAQRKSGGRKLAEKAMKLLCLSTGGLSRKMAWTLAFLFCRMAPANNPHQQYEANNFRDCAVFQRGGCLASMVQTIDHGDDNGKQVAGSSADEGPAMPDGRGWGRMRRHQRLIHPTLFTEPL